jgi:hypothetical protein
MQGLKSSIYVSSNSIAFTSKHLEKLDSLKVKKSNYLNKILIRPIVLKNQHDGLEFHQFCRVVC